MKTVFTGWRNVTPGPCHYCGYDNDYFCNGRGVVFCGCQTCPDCHVFDGHASNCNLVDEETHA